MARTKQTTRKNTGGKAPRQERNRGGNLKRTVITQEVLITKRKERREKKMKLVHDKPIHHSGSSTFSDLTIKFQTLENVEEIELFKHLKVKMNNHVCGERCFTEIPQINYALLNTKDDCAFRKVLFGVGPCYSICDEECPKADKKFAFEIFEEFVKEQDEFESSLKEVEIYTDEELEKEFIFLREENEHKIKSSTMEYLSKPSQRVFQDIPKKPRHPLLRFEVRNKTVTFEFEKIVNLHQIVEQQQKNGTIPHTLLIFAIIIINIQQPSSNTLPHPSVYQH